MATLKSLVDETGNIKDELKTCHINLKNNLIAKGVECSDSDKMLSLINKVDYIEGYLFTDIESEKEITLSTFIPSNTNAIQSVGKFTEFCSIKSIIKGKCNIVINCRNTNDNYKGSIKIVINDNEASTFYITGTSFYDIKTKVQLNENDIIKISYMTVASGYGIYLNSARVTSYIEPI